MFINTGVRMLTRKFMLLLPLVLLQVSVGTEQKQGELNVALTYNDHVQRLLVGIIEGRNLKASIPGMDTCAAGRWRPQLMSRVRRQ